MHHIAGWWDGFELWVASLPFLPQFAVVLIGMVPISFAIAYLLDRILRAALRMLGRDRSAESAPVGPDPLGAEAMDSPPEEHGPREPGPMKPVDGPRQLVDAARQRQKESV